MADIAVTLHLPPLALEAVVLLLDAEVEAVDDLIAEEQRRGATQRFIAEMRQVRAHWEALRGPIAAAEKSARDRVSVSGEIDTEDE